MEGLVAQIVLNDQKELKKAKIDEFERGELPDGNRIGYYRDKNYREFKQTLNPLASGTVDLILTGRTVSTLFVRRSGSPRAYIFGMNDRYNLIGKYGIDILGLNEQTFEQREARAYAPELVKLIKSTCKIS